MTDNEHHEDMTSMSYFDHSSAKRVNTDMVLIEAIRTQYPNLDLVVAPQGRLNLLAYASAGFAKAVPLDDVVKDPVYGPGVKWRSYLPPSRRLDTSPGVMAERVSFGKYMYKWKDQEFIVYVIPNSHEPLHPLQRRAQGGRADQGGDKVGRGAAQRGLGF
jgi:transitional endoplasmic reticulum ATPase